MAQFTPEELVEFRKAFLIDRRIMLPALPKGCKLRQAARIVHREQWDAAETLARIPESKQQAMYAHLRDSDTKFNEHLAHHRKMKKGEPPALREC